MSPFDFMVAQAFRLYCERKSENDFRKTGNDLNRRFLLESQFLEDLVSIFRLRHEASSAERLSSPQNLCYWKRESQA